MNAPSWARLLLRLLAPRDRTDEVLGDLEEAHQSHLRRRGRIRAALRTTLETVDMAFALLRSRLGGFSWLDFKLGFRMLLRYPGLTVVAGVAIAFAIAAGFGDCAVRHGRPSGRPGPRTSSPRPPGSR